MAISALLEVPKEKAPGRPSRAAYQRRAQRYGLASTYHMVSLERRVLTIAWQITKPERTPIHKVMAQIVWPLDSGAICRPVTFLQGTGIARAIFVIDQKLIDKLDELTEGDLRKVDVRFILRPNQF
jgi:hypothetical protein